jgi:hypothetical protein
MADTSDILPGMGIFEGGYIVEGDPATTEPITAGSSQPIGTVESSSGSVTVQHADGTSEQLEAGSPIFQGDQLETGCDGSVGVVLADGTAFSMAEGGKMVMDEMVYDPSTQESSIGINAVQGVFAFVSGQIAKTDPDAMTLETPVATIGIRGTQVGIVVGEGGQSNVILMEEADGFVGEVVVSNEGGVQILNNALQGTSIVNQQTGPAESFQVNEDQLVGTFGRALGHLPANDNNNANTYNQEIPGEQSAVEDAEQQEALEEQLAQEEQQQEEAAEQDLSVEQLAEEELSEEQLGEEALSEEVAAEEVLAEEDGSDLDNFDTAIALDIDAALTDTDGSETLSVTIAGVPSGAALSAGTDNGGGSWTLTEEQVEGLTVTLAENSDDDFNLTVTATSTETGGGDTASTESTITVEVAGVADTPVVTVQNEVGNEDQWIQLNLDSALTDTDGSESLTINIANVPEETILSPGTNDGNGNWSVSAEELSSVCILPPADFNGQIDMTLNVTSTEIDGNAATEIESFSVTVNPTADVPVVIGSGSGAEDSAIDLDISATMPNSTEGVESVTISGLPEGAELSAGTDNGDGSFTLSPDDLDGLTVTPPADFNGSLEMYVSATPTDGSESSAIPVSVSVSAVADVPTVSLSAASGDEDSTIELDITASVPNSTETVESITISGVPSGATLSVGADNEDGSWTVSAADMGNLSLTPAQDFNGSFNLTVSAMSTDGGQSDGASLNVDVEPVPETTNLKFTVSNESVNENSDSLDLLTVAPDDFGTTETVEFNYEEIDVTYVDADSAFAEFTDAWGEVSDIDAESEFAADVTIDNFADADVDLGDDGDSTVTIDNVAQGDISTGDGDDVVDVDALSLGGDWSNLFDIDTGDGSDQVTVTGGQDLTEIDIDTGAGGDTVNLDESYLEAVVDTGEGDEVIVGGSGDDTILAGAGDDLMSGGSGSNIIDGGDGTDTLQLANNYDDYSISFDGEQMIVSGPEGVDTVTGVEVLEFGDGTLTVADIAQDPVVSISTFGGDEDTAIAINIGVDIANPFEEVATVSIAGIPEGAELSAGTGNGGGNWTLTAEDLNGLTVTPPQDFLGQLDLSVSATSTEGVTSGSSPLPVSIASMNDASILKGGGTLEVDAGGTTITSDDFNVVDVDNDPSEITYALTDGPDNGTLFLDGEALDDDMFTQENIDNGLLQYTAEEAGFSWAEGTPSWDQGGAPLNQRNLTVPKSAEGVIVVFEGESAEFHNTVGWYKLDENGNPSEPQVLFIDASEDGNILEKGTEITLEGLEPGEQFGFFIIQDGANKYPDLADAVAVGTPIDFDENGNLTFETNPILRTNNDDNLVDGAGEASDGSSTVTIEASDVFFTGDTLNPDGVNHAMSGLNVNGNLQIGFEDLTGGGDNDFNDAMISIKYEGVDEGASSDTFNITANDGKDDLQDNVDTDSGCSATGGEAAENVVIDYSGV